jgi:hypothetical protein
MVNQVVCPKCKKVYTNTPIIKDAANREGSATQSITCECGERITYWQITDQLREHETMGWKFKIWVRSFSHSRN